MHTTVTKKTAMPRRIRRLHRWHSWFIFRQNVDSKLGFVDFWARLVCKISDNERATRATENVSWPCFKQSLIQNFRKHGEGYSGAKFRDPSSVSSDQPILSLNSPLFQIGENKRVTQLRKPNFRPYGNLRGRVTSGDSRIWVDGTGPLLSIYCCCGCYGVCRSRHKSQPLKVDWWFCICRFFELILILGRMRGSLIGYF